jgi:ankyrin repeat protein
MLERIADGRTDLVLVHVSEGGPVSAVDGGGTSLLGWCAYYGDVSAMRFLLSRGESLASLGEDLGLNSAAFHGHWRLCQFLIESGADVRRAQPDTGETPLHAVLSRANHPASELVVEVLLAAGADPNAATKPGAPTGAFMRDSRTKGETPLHRAAAFGSETSIRRLLDAGARIDAKDAGGDSPLSWASWHLRPAAVLRMLSYGEHRIHAHYVSTGDHGSGPSAMDLHLLGKPHV